MAFASELRWFTADELPADIAYDHQKELFDKWAAYLNAAKGRP